VYVEENLPPPITMKEAMTEGIKILCVDDERNVLRALERLFLDDDYEIFSALSGEQGLERLAEEGDIQIVISDYRMPGLNGVDFLQKVCTQWPHTVRIVLSGYADTAAVVGAINEGQIYKFIPKPWNDDELRVTIQNAVERYFLTRQNALLLEELQTANENLRSVNEGLEAEVLARTAKLTCQNQALTVSQNILDALPVGVVGVDSTGMVVCCNQAGRAFFQERADFILGNSSQALFPEALLNFLEEMAPAKGRGLRSEVSWTGKRVRVQGARLDQDDQAGIVLVLEVAGD